MIFNFLLIFLRKNTSSSDQGKQKTVVTKTPTASTNTSTITVNNNPDYQTITKLRQEIINLAQNLQYYKDNEKKKQEIEDQINKKYEERIQLIISS